MAINTTQPTQQETFSQYVTALPPASGLSGSEQIVVIQGGTAKQALASYFSVASGNLPSDGSAGQILNKISAINFNATWSSIISFVSGDGTTISTSGNATSIVLGLVANSIGSGQLATGGVVATSIAANAIGSSQLSTGGVVATSIAANVIGSSQLATGGVVATSIAANAVGNAQFRQSVGLSVVGVAGTATANVADITAFAPGQVLQVNNAGNALVFASLTAVVATSIPSVLQFAGTANIQNGTTDAFPAFQLAFNALTTSGGGMLFVPPGTYNFSTGAMTPPNNVIVQGAGIDATIIKNTALFPNSVTIQIPFTLTGSSWPSTPITYPINAPTLGSTIITMTNATNAGNFIAGNYIFVSGGTHGTSFWYPGWYTTVATASATTGLITLNETLPLGGSQLTLVQQIVALPTNITVRDMTIVSGTTAAIECQGGRDFLFENLKIIPGAAGVSSADVTFGIHKNSTFRHIIMEQGAQPLELFVSNNCTIDDCHITNGYILVDGGSFDCVVTNSTVKDPQQNNANVLQSFHGIHIPDYTSRIRVIGNSVVGIPNGFNGINIVANPDSNRNHLVMGNTLVGAGGSGGSANGLNTSDGVVVGNFFSNLANAMQLQSTESPICEGNFYDLANPNGNNINPFSLPAVYRTIQNRNIMAMPAGTTTPTVQGMATYTLTQSGAQNVSNFVGALAGDMIWVATTDAHTTFVSGSGITMKGGTNYTTVPANTVLQFMALSNTTWIEVSRTQ